MKKLHTLMIISTLMIMTVSTNGWAQAKFIFSNTPFGSATAAGKAKFKSSESIYGRVEFPKSAKEFFDTDNSDTRSYPKGVLVLNLRLTDNQGILLGEIYGKHLLPSDAELNSNYLNFDVSPEPSKATTLTSMVPTFDAGLFSVPFVTIFDQSSYYHRVPDLVDGNTYTVEVKISRWTFSQSNPSNPKAPDFWTDAKGTFQVEYHSSDVPTLTKNKKAADDLVKENARKKAMANRGLPEEWNTWKGPNATGHTEKQLIDMFLSQRQAGSKVYKVVIEPKPSGPLWDIIRDNGITITERDCMQLVGFFAIVNGQYGFYRMGVRESYLGGDKYDVANAWVQIIEHLDIESKFIPTTAPIATK